MARPGSLLPAPGRDEEEADQSSPRLLPRSSPTPRPRLVMDEAAQSPRGEPGSSLRHVRFADALGLPLVAAVCYDSLCCAESPELPLLVGRCYGNLCCADGTLRPLVAAEGNAGLTPSSPDPAQELGALGPSWKDSQSSFYLCPTFLLPCSPLQLEQRVLACGVELESLLPCPSDPRALQGMLRVLNVSYSKSVYVRATFDRWITYFDHPAEYVASCDDGRTDQFAFRLAFPLLCTSDGARLEFVARYETPAQTYWANNGGRNYGVVLKACGGAPAQPATKPLFWELQQRQLKSCLKPVKNRPAVADSPQDTFSATVGLTSERNDLLQLLKPTPLHPEQTNNQVPTLVVTSTSPEKLHSYRPIIFTEAKLYHSANKGGYVGTPAEHIKGIWKPSEEAEQQLRKDKSTWIGDLSTLGHAEAAFINLDKNPGNVTQELVPERSLPETQTNPPTVGPRMICPYIPSISDDSENEDAVEEELEQLYLSHLSRLKAAKELKNPSEGELGQGVLKEPHVAPDWNVPVSPLKFAGTKRVLNTWLAEEISLRHGDERGQERSTDVASGTAELSSLQPDSAKLEVPSCVLESLTAARVGEGTQPPCIGGALFNVGEHSECSECGQPSMGSKQASLISSETDASGITHVSLPEESCSVTKDRTTRLPCKPDNAAAAALSLSKDINLKNIYQVLEQEFKIVAPENLTHVLSRRSDHTYRAKQEQVPLNGEICEAQTQQDLEEQTLPSDTLHEAETLANQHKASQINYELQTTQNLRERVQLSKALPKLETFPNQQERDRLSENLHKPHAPLDLQERILLSEELHEVETDQNLQERVQLSEGLQEPETSQDLEEQVLLLEELHELEMAHTIEEQVLMSENLPKLELTRNLQERVLLNESLWGLQSSRNLPKRPLLCEELPVLETPQNWQERLQLCEELHEIESPRNMQEHVILSEELCGLDSSKNVQDQGLSSKEISVVDAAQNLKESVLLSKEHHNLQVRQNMQERLFMEENVCRFETSETQNLYKTFLLTEELCEQDVTHNPLHEKMLSYLELSPHLQEPLKKDKNSELKVALSPIERVLLSESICQMESQNNLPVSAAAHLKRSCQSACADEGIGYLSTFCVPLGEELGSPSCSCSPPAQGVPGQVSVPSVEAALALSSHFLCVVVFLCVILQSCMSSAEALLFLGAVWFL